MMQKTVTRLAALALLLSNLMASAGEPGAQRKSTRESPRDIRQPASSGSVTRSERATEYYVDGTNGDDANSGTGGWKNAKKTIQAAVDIAADGSTVLVADGTYDTGGAVTPGYALMNRVCVTKPITIRSVNGAETTRIVGAGPVGPEALRGVYLGENAVLDGFTVTNGHTLTSGDYQKDRSGGGIWCEPSAVVTSCTISGNTADSSGGGAYGGTLTNCTITGNTADSSGGGAYGGTLTNCTITGNTASEYGGGACEGTLTNCTITGNTASNGGGACEGTLTNCTITGNTADWSGGGVYCLHYGTLTNCTITGNTADWSGGGVCCGFCGTLTNCTITGNTTNGDGGGAYCPDYPFYGTLTNCTITGNTANGDGGGVYGGRLTNCLVYFNSAARTNPNYFGGTLRYCCTTPASGGEGNISVDPLLASASHLSARSPCIGAGSAQYATGTDIDGDAWTDPPSIGCDEVVAGASTGSLTVDIVADYTTVATGFEVDFTASIRGRTTGSRWDFGDDMVVANQPYASHAWDSAGAYQVVLTALNDTFPDGESVSLTITVVEQPIHYVSADSANPLPPYSSWEAAATTIQDAVDAAEVTGALVLVGDGVYDTSGAVIPEGALVNRVCISKPITVRSVNGAETTQIVGAGPAGPEAVRGVYLGADAVLDGFTVTNGHTLTTGDWGDWGDWRKDPSGGGIWCEAQAVVTNCTITGNTASEDGGGVSRGTLTNCTIIGNTANGDGGGAYGGTLTNCTITGNTSDGSGGGASRGTLTNCTITGNTAHSSGGGAQGGTLTNCTITGNTARDGGGASRGTLTNCLVYFNSAARANPNWFGGTLHYCCTTPASGGEGNIGVDPLLASASHLSARSPCIGAGSAQYATGTDIDGDAWTDPPSIGCDEVVSGASTGSLTVAIAAAYTTVATGFEMDFTAFIDGRTTGSRWDFGDDTVVANQPYASHAWDSAGVYQVVLTALNDTYPDGESVSLTITVVEQPIHYVSADSANPLPPYSSWEAAATMIQDAVDAAEATGVTGALVLVGDGVYDTGGAVIPEGALVNRVCISKPITVRSVNGAETTQIVGAGPAGPEAVRGVCLGADAVLDGFTVTNGHTYSLENSGGGISCKPSAVVTNCTITGNAAYNGGGAYGGTLTNCTITENTASYGGGAYGGTLTNCTITGNTAWRGGGAYGGTLTNCTITGNTAHGDGGGAYGGTLTNCTITGNTAHGDGGGAYYGTLTNCIVYFNSAPAEPNWSDGMLRYCCTTPEPSGEGNVTGAPQFIDAEGGNFRLQPASPCIDAGDGDASPTTDTDGYPREDAPDTPTTGVGAVAFADIGAYEYSPTRYSITLRVGWNLISLPLAPLDSAVTSVFDEANFTGAGGGRSTIYADSVWAWNRAAGLYDAVTTVTPGVGYWIYVTTAGTLRVHGSAPTSSGVLLLEGWNAVGVVAPMAASDRAGIFLPVWWQWNAVEQTYRSLRAGDIANPGVGVWIYALEAAELAPEQ